MVWAVVISLVGSTWYLLRQAYTYGGINLNQYFFVGSQKPFQDVAGWIANPMAVNWEGWFYVAVGGGVMVLLMLARHYFLWWPLHPVGFPIGHDLGYEPDLGKRLLGVVLQERGVEVRGAWIVQTNSAIFLGIGSGQCGCGRRVVSDR